MYTDTERKYFYPNIIEKVTTSFMSLFTDIRIAKYDNNSFLNYRNVPITFGLKQKFLTARTKEGQFDFSFSLPRLSVMLTALNQQPEKVQGSELLPYLNPISSTEFNTVFRPTPYSLEFTLSILSLHLTECNQILEQIVPFFTPYRIITIREIDAIPSFTRDLKILLTGVTPTFQEEIGEDDVRKFIWDLTFKVDCFLYKPILISKIIKTVKVELLDLNTSNLEATYTYAVSGDSINYIVTSGGWIE